MSQHQADILLRNIFDKKLINMQEARLINAAISDRALALSDIENRDRLRLNIFKHMLTSLIVRDASSGFSIKKQGGMQ